MNKELLKQAFELINKNEKSIIFYDGEIIEKNINENIIINEKPLNFSFEIPYQVDDIKSSISISKDTNIKLIFINAVKTQIIIDKDANINITNVYLNIDNDSNQNLDIICEEDSNTLIKTCYIGSNSFSAIANAYCLNNAYIKLDSLSLNKSQVNSTISVYLLKQGAHADLVNVIINQSNKLQDYNYNIQHIDRDTNSSLFNYGIAKNTSTLNLNNKGHINKGAINTKLVQKSKGIILDLYSAISANPILEIDENDVIANHGASIGAIDEEELYYLMSRGLNNEESERLIVNAFIAPYFRNFKDEKVMTFIKEAINKYL